MASGPARVAQEHGPLRRAGASIRRPRRPARLIVREPERSPSFCGTSWRSSATRSGCGRPRRRAAGGDVRFFPKARSLRRKPPRCTDERPAIIAIATTARGGCDPPRIVRSRFGLSRRCAPKAWGRATALPASSPTTSNPSPSTWPRGDGASGGRAPPISAGGGQRSVEPDSSPNCWLGLPLRLAGKDIDITPASAVAQAPSVRRCLVRAARGTYSKRAGRSRMARSYAAQPIAFHRQRSTHRWSSCLLGTTAAKCIVHSAGGLLRSTEEE